MIIYHSKCVLTNGKIKKVKLIFKLLPFKKDVDAKVSNGSLVKHAIIACCAYFVSFIVVGLGLISNDIKNNDSYVMVLNDKVIATIFASFNEEITYNKIYDGK